MNAYEKMSKNYQNLELESRINDATPHELTGMFFASLKTNIRRAQVCMEHKNLEQQSMYINKAINIVQNLQENLDYKQGGSIAGNLNRMYNYINKQLIIGNAKNSTKELKECYNMTNEISDAWQQIKPANEPSIE